MRVGGDSDGCKRGLPVQDKAERRMVVPHAPNGKSRNTTVVGLKKQEIHCVGSADLPCKEGPLFRLTDHITESVGIKV